MRGGSWSEGRRISAILAAAFLLRLVCAVGVQRHLDHGSHEVCLIPGDADGYWELARKLSAGEDYELYQPPRRVMRMPGFPFLLAMPRLVWGDHRLAARIWLAVIGTAACGFTYLLGKELWEGAVGLWAAAIVAISPVLSLFSVLILSETAFAAAMTASLFVLVRLQRRLREQPTRLEPILAFSAGMLVAIATYLRPTWLLIGPIAAACLLAGPEWKRRLRAAGLVCAGLYLSLLPWGLRNQFVTGHFTLTTFWVGPSLYDGLNPEANGDSRMEFFDRENLLGRMSEYEMDREYRRRAWEYAWQNPRRAVELMVIKACRYAALWPNAAQFRQTWMQAVVFASASLILFPALYGTWIARRRLDVLLVAWGPLLYFAAIHMLFVGSIRYRLPAEYPFAVLSGLGVAGWISGVGRETKSVNGIAAQESLER